MQSLISRYYQPLFVSIVAVVVGLSFYTGFLEGKNTEQQKVTLSCSSDVLNKLSIPTQVLGEETSAGAASLAPQTGAYVGSKNGTKYYTPSCSAVQKIKPANYIWFNSAQDAQIEGYSAGKC
jgi:hypothetical protein